MAKKQEIQFNNGIGTIGSKLLSFGLDMQCHKCVSIVTLIEWNEDNNTYVIESEGIQITCNIISTTWEGKIKDAHKKYSIYTPTRYNEMIQECIKERKAWTNAVTK